MPKPVIRTNLFVLRFLGELLYLSLSCFASHFLFMAAIAMPSPSTMLIQAQLRLLLILYQLSSKSHHNMFTMAFAGEGHEMANRDSEKMVFDNGWPLGSIGN